jgi:hypothetical protein
MDVSYLSGFLLSSLEVLAAALVLALGVGAVTVVAVYVIDRNQTEHAVRRNYPVIGRFRYIFEHVGEFFRDGSRRVTIQSSATQLVLSGGKKYRQHDCLWIDPRSAGEWLCNFRQLSLSDTY